MHISQLFQDALHQPMPAIAYFVSQQLAALFPDRGYLETQDCSFQLDGYIQAGHCTAAVKPDLHAQILAHWGGEHPYLHVRTAWLAVTWQDHPLDVFKLTWTSAYGEETWYWVFADQRAIAQQFFAAVCDWFTEVRDEVLVFHNSYWTKDAELFRAIKSATFDNLILAGTLKQDIQADLDHFFSAQSLYAEYGIPWKRGILLIGPPGNGKTHTVKALINKLQKPCLYVKSFRGHDTESENIRRVFDKARRSAPCVLVLEDLDSLLNDYNRSFFLNELDGFARNEGVITLGTTNYPDRLDPAIIERPSRFDRKYHFNLPAAAERDAYIRLWNDKLKPVMRLSEAGIAEVAEKTEGFSFAYLRELFLTLMMAWMEKMTPGSMDEVMRSQVGKLREQMTSAAPKAAAPPTADF